MPPSSNLLKTSLQHVHALRQAHENPSMAQALAQIKQLQVQRFRYEYADLLTNPRYEKATQFFLDELYGCIDFAQRDAQFARIATTIERLFSASVMQVAVQLAQTHLLTESLDHAMAQHWAAAQSAKTAKQKAQLYLACWHQVGQAPQREQQLQSVLDLGQQLDQLVGTPGLRTALRLMRWPAQKAGLAVLQNTLECGFDAFASMKGANAFLTLIAQREGQFLQRLFTGSAPSALQVLTQCQQS
jgi:hypothetical protein